MLKNDEKNLKNFKNLLTNWVDGGKLILQVGTQLKRVLKEGGN